MICCRGTSQVVVSLASNVSLGAAVDMVCPVGTNFVDTFGGLYATGAFPVQTTVCDNSATYSRVLASSLQFACSRWDRTLCCSTQAFHWSLSFVL